MSRRRTAFSYLTGAAAACLLASPAFAQLTDRTIAPNQANEGIAKSFEQQIGAGRGNVITPGSSLFIIKRDPARAIRRGRQIFQRKFTRAQGQGPLERRRRRRHRRSTCIIGAGLADSCAACHGRPRGSAGFGGDVVTRPDSRDAPHLFGLGLKEMLADEITAELRAIRASGHQPGARASAATVTRNLVSKGDQLRHDHAPSRTGQVNTSGVAGVNPDLRVRPFFLHGETISIREFLVGAFNAEMGLESPDPDLIAGRGGREGRHAAGMVLDGRTDDDRGAAGRQHDADDDDGDGVVNEIPTSIVDFMEFYLLNYFKAGHRRADVSPAEVDRRPQPCSRSSAAPAATSRI